MTDFVHKAQYKKVVLDAGVAIRLQRPENLGQECFMTPDVFGEIKDTRARMHLQTFTVPLKHVTPTAQDIAWVRSFASKTGDIGFLSDNDIGIIALCYMLQRQTGNVKNLKLKPADVTVVARQMGHSWAPPKSVNEDGSSTNAPTGLKFKELTEAEMDALEAELNADFEQDDNEDAKANEEAYKQVESEVQKARDTAIKAAEEAEKKAMEEQAQQEQEQEDEDSDLEDDGWGAVGVKKSSEPKKTRQQVKVTAPAPVAQVILEVGDKAIVEELDGADCGEWVTPSNFKNFGNLIGDKNTPTAERETVEDEVALVSTDYSVQNVALQMGLSVATVSGMKIRSVKLWAQLCSTCNHLERDTTKLFCKGCGYPNFRRVPLVVDQRSGEVRVHDNPNRKFNLRGINYSIPKLKGGRSANDIIFCEAQLYMNNRQHSLNAARKAYARQLQEANPFNDLGNYADRGWWGAAKANIGGKNNAHRTAPKPVIGMGSGNPNSNRFQKKRNGK